MTIRARVTWLLAGLTSALVLASSAALLWTERRALAAEAHRSRESLADGFARTCRDALAVKDELAALNAAGDLGRRPGVRRAFAVDGGGRVAAHSAAGHLGRAAEEDAPEAGVWRVERPLPLPEGVGRAVVDFDLGVLRGDVAAALAPARRRILLVALGALGFGVAGAGLLSRTLTGPILRIARGTHALAEGRLDHRIEALGRDELGRLAEDFNRMAERLGEVDKMKNAFVANVTHELRSPIAAIESCAALISDEVRAGDLADVPLQLSAVRNNATRLGRLVNDVLDLARIDAGRVDPAPERLSAREVAGEVVALFRAKAAEKSVALSQADIPDALTVWADPDPLCQVLTNLVGNALKFTPAGGRVTVGAAPEGGGVCFTVEDTGPGIRAEDQARIFERFEQVRAARDGVEGPKGTGLGLSIAQGLVAAHGGRLGLRSEWGRGSTFTAWFPGEA